MRYNELKRNLPNTSERMLVTQLRELKNDLLVKRIVYPEVPPRVEYELTPIGYELKPIIEQLENWGNKHKKLL